MSSNGTLGSERVTSPYWSLETQPAVFDLHKGRIPNTPLASATISFLLGSIFALAVRVLLVDLGVPAVLLDLVQAGKLTGGTIASNVPLVQLSFFFATWSAFHWGEFAVTAGWNRARVSVDSYLLENGNEYHIAHLAALIEHFIIWHFWPTAKRHAYLTPIGMTMALCGMFLRSKAMITAAQSFNHAVQSRKRADHSLVTHGVYSIFRHPSYAGFFYYSVGTQIALQNPICTIGFTLVLQRFFSRRIRYEEVQLVKFFGDDYVAYRNRVRTWIPFIP